jgi:hypothetical protein
MPGFDGTGPRGLGSGTGWGRGPCGAGLRRGAGRRCGGFGRWGYAYPGPGSALSARGTGYASGLDETEARRHEKAYLEGELETIQKRLAELDKRT